MADPGQISRLRSLQRQLTTRIGVLDEAFLGTSRPLAQNRLLYEVRRHPSVRELRLWLGLDSGYASRLLAALRDEGLVELRPDPADARGRVAHLTAAGEAEVARLDRLADAAATGLVDGLAPPARERLAAAAATLTDLLVAATTRIDVAEPTDPRVTWCLEQYLAELDGRVAGGLRVRGMVSADPLEVAPPHGQTLLATSLEEPVGCGMLKRTVPGTVDIKRVWLDPRVRGAGLAGRLMDRLEETARALGCHTARLETNEALTEAIAMYRRRGYVEVEPFNDEPNAHHWFALRL
jgi:DNA-binding MarR family transcriptional regulator/GNAT superfamily N-acetyltransferase